MSGLKIGRGHRITDPNIDGAIDGIAIPLQAQASRRVKTSLLSSLEISTDVVGSTITANNASGYIRYRYDGEILDVGVDFYGGAQIVGATCQFIKIRLPDGLYARSLGPLGNNLDARTGIAVAKIVLGGATSNGFLWLQGNYLYIVRDAAAPFTVGAFSAYGQVWGEAVQLGELQG